MDSKITRRGILRFVGGSALGLVLSPLPWKVLDDSAIWTQNWPWIPEPSRGPASHRFTTCSLCPESCGMRARCIASQPVSLSGTSGHPLNEGTLCPMGVVAHHLRYHPARLKHPVKIVAAGSSFNRTQLSIEQSIAEITNAIRDAGTSSNGSSVVVLDGRPGRTASFILEDFARRTAKGAYVPVGEPSLDVLQSMLERPIGPLAYDIDNTETILCFGAPLLDGWGTPARPSRFLGRQSGAKIGKRQQLIQIETVQSRTALFADRWIPLMPGTETILALGLGNIIVDEKLYRPSVLDRAKDFREYKELVKRFDPIMVEQATGIATSTIRDIARTFASSRAPLALIGDTTSDGMHSMNRQTAVMALNLLVGSVGRSGGIVLGQEVPQIDGRINRHGIASPLLHDVPDHSIHVMILDESLSGSVMPDAILKRKLIKDTGIIISLSPFETNRPFCTQYIIPTPVLFESLTDLVGSLKSSTATLSFSMPILPAAKGTTEVISFVQRLAQALDFGNFDQSPTELLMRKRIDALHRSGKGSVFSAANGQITSMRSFASPVDVWNTLAAGGCWHDSSVRSVSIPEFRMVGKLTEKSSLQDAVALRANLGSQLLLAPYSESKPYDGIEVSPLMSKVGQESGLRPYACQAFLNPATGADHGIADGESASLHSKNGTLRIVARFDTSLMPGVIALGIPGTEGNGRIGNFASSPGEQDFFAADMSNSFHPIPVTIRKA